MGDEKVNLRAPILQRFILPALVTINEQTKLMGSVNVEPRIHIGCLLAGFRSLFLVGCGPKRLSRSAHNTRNIIGA